MGHLTLANQLTILRIMLIPVFVLLVVYGYLGWALIVFLTAGITDALDGLIARRAGQRTTLGAWLDPMADKLLLVTTFIVLTLPGVPLTNHIPLWLTVFVISRDVVIVGVVAIVRTIRIINGVFARVVDGMPLMRPRPPASTARIAARTARIMRRLNTPVK